jgi:nitrite reductase/ring-hydroxylating ferredoxin subunit
MVHVPTKWGARPPWPRRADPPGYGASTEPSAHTDRCGSSWSGRGVGATWLMAARSRGRQGRRLDQPSHGETVVITRQPDGGVAAFHNVCRHRGRRSSPSGRVRGRKFTCPYGWMYDTTGKVIGVPEKVDFDQGSCGPAGAGRRRGRVGRVGLGEPGRSDRASSRSGSARTSRSTSASKMDDMVTRVLEWDVPVNYRRSSTASTRSTTPPRAPRRPGVDEVGKDTTFHVVNDLATCASCRGSDTGAAGRAGTTSATPSATTCVPNTVFNCNPEHVQVFSPSRSTSTGQLPVLGLVTPVTTTISTSVPGRMLRRRTPEGRRRRGHRHLPAAGPDQAVNVHPDILVARVQIALPREDGGDDQGLIGSVRRQPVSGAGWPAAPWATSQSATPATWPPRRGATPGVRE